MSVKQIHYRQANNGDDDTTTILNDEGSIAKTSSIEPLNFPEVKIKVSEMLRPS